ncbi:MAG: hypothetical protein MPJ50_11210 [Pirellulales bacterium]|nr:hypothetical protein [Pirellulales bacterium]
MRQCGMVVFALLMSLVFSSGEALAQAKKSFLSVDKSPLRLTLRTNDSVAPDNRGLKNLIAALGSPNFYIRERATQQIERFGVRAFDALAVAEEHADLEVAARARVLLRRLSVDLLRPTDTSAVRSILKRFAAQPERQRESDITRLAELPQNLGVGGLARLARFESSSRLARLAALRLIRAVRVNSADWYEQREMIEAELADSERTPVRWLRKHLTDDPFGDGEAQRLKSMETWRSFARREVGAVHDGPGTYISGLTSSAIGLELYEHAGEQLTVTAKGSCEFRRQLEELTQEMIAACDDSVPSLMRVMRWIQIKRLPESLAILHERFREPLESHPLLVSVYALRTESLLGVEAAEAAWEKATEVRQFTPAELGYFPLEADLPPIYLAYRLEKEGGTEFAQREYHQVIREQSAGMLEALQARMLLAESLANQSRYGEAAAFMEQAADAMWDNERRGRQGWGTAGPDPAEVESRAKFFAALECRHTDNEKYVALLRASINVDASNPDGLIELFGHQGNTSQQLAALRQMILNALSVQQQRFVEDPTNDDAYNLWAWLAAKTFGDPDQALAHSMESLRLNPGSTAYYDTMATCFAAKRDFVNAVRCQTWAVNADPFSHKYRHRLAKYRRQLKAHERDTGTQLTDKSSGDTQR